VIFNWIAFVAARYVSSSRRNSPSAIFSILGIAVGVLALTVIISVMNGFQLGFIESIIEVSSGHIRIDNFPGGETGEALLRRIRSLKEVKSALPFRETSALVRGRLASPRGVVVRGLAHDALEKDPGLKGKLEIEEGYFDLESPQAMVIGAELARRLAVRVGDKVLLLSISSPFTREEDNAHDDEYTITGVFRCGFYEYDLGWAYINLSHAENFFLSGGEAALGIKLNKRWQDYRALDLINAELAGLEGKSGEPPKATSWRDYNRAFFGALRTEKLMMFILVGLIFIVVGLNIVQAQRRAVLERREEIGLLRAMGASDLAVRLIFVWDGFIIGMSGAGIGLLLGLFISSHISAFFTFLEGAVNFAIGLVNTVSRFAGIGGEAEEFSVFSPQIFYIKEIPSRIIPHEVALIFLFGFLSALGAAWIASFRASRAKPAEVLRYE
jgi:lipoprotein-releasing system permease protein